MGIQRITTVHERVSYENDFGWNIATDLDAEGISMAYFDKGIPALDSEKHVIGCDMLPHVIQAMVTVAATSYPEERERLRRMLTEVIESLGLRP